MKLAVLESPLGGKYIDTNTLYARSCMHQLLNAGFAPYASHLLYPQVLNDHFDTERLQGMRAGRQVSISLLSQNAAHYFFTDLGWSSGMEEALAYSADGQRVLARNHFSEHWADVRAMIDYGEEPEVVYRWAADHVHLRGVARVRDWR